MTSTVTKIELISEMGTFSFTEYSSLSDFDKNNWKQLGETSYNVHRTFSDGTKSETLHEGINGSYFLVMDIEGEVEISVNVD